MNMKLFQAVLNLFAISLLVNGDNTPNLCTEDVPNLTKIKPSETAMHSIPNITVGGYMYDGDADHFVIRPSLKGSKTYNHVMVYIPGTTDRPELSSCLLKSAANTFTDIPIIGLSYAYLNSGDKFRNGKCAGLPTQTEQIECLEEQHKDAIDGGDFGATHFKDDGTAFWDEVLEENALKRRLGDLLAYLHDQHETEGWDNFLESGSPNHPKWENMIVSGHSQGAGHVAYLAKTEKLHGAVMISGPQDECIGCPAGTKFWIDEGPYASSGHASFTALGHGSEPLIDVMKDNWMRMKEAEPSINWKSATSSNVLSALDTTRSDACASPLQTDVQYADTSTCGGAEHCSTAIDDSVPIGEKSNGDEYYLYEKSVWPALFKGGEGCQEAGASNSKSSKSKPSKSEAGASSSKSSKSKPSKCKCY